MAVFISVIAGVIGAAPKILSLFAPLKKHISYASRCNDFIRDLGFEVERLNEERESLQGRIGFARRNLEVIHPSVEGWIRRANEMITEANRILDTVPEVQNCTFPSGTCLNLKSRYSQGKQAKKMTEDVKQLREECSKFERVSDPAPLTGTETIPPTTSGTLEFESQKRKGEGIMECLRDDKILMIGICGMGGVGKTTMVDKILKRAIEEKLFDEIVKVIVSRSVDLLNIQKQIARPLGLQLEDEKIVSVIANRLHKRLLAANKVLLYFDDVWERLDLEGLGIPSQSKIILTSRDQEVCRQMMTIEDDCKILKLDGLTKDESWELFREKTGSVVNKLHLRHTAVEVARECKGLPLALATIGRAMRGRTERAAWDDALHQLRVAAPANIRGYIKDVYQPLKLSYDALESVEARDLFLLCCLFPKDSNIPIEGLVYYGVALQIFTATTNIRQARDRAHNLVDMLKSRFLLIDADDSNCRWTKMHDVIRDMALSIASRDEHGFMVSHYTAAWPEDVSPENCTRISLILRQKVVLPTTLKYPRLEALHLEIPYSNIERTRWPESFFDGMTGLRFLRIKNAITSPTLRMLKQLRVLNLSFCESKMIYEIGELVNLEILHLNVSKIEMLPKEIGALTKLKLLDLDYSNRLKKIAPGVVSSLSQLEELGLSCCPIEWEVEERGSERSNASLTEVFFLRNLSLLDIQIGSLRSPSYFEHIGELVNLEILRLRDSKIGILPKEIGALTKLKLLDLNYSFRLKKIAPGVVSSLSQLEELGLRRCPIEWEVEERGSERNNASLTEVFSLKNLSLLDIQIGGPRFPNKQALSKLGTGKFYREFPIGNTKCFRELRIGFLQGLRTLFSLEVFRGLINLEKLLVFDCPMLEKIIKLEEHEEQRGRNIIEKTIIPRLISLKLSRLPKICYFCTFSNALELPSLKWLIIKECPMMMTFALESRNGSISNSNPRSFLCKQVICQKLRYLCLIRLNFSTPIFSHEIPTVCVSALQSLYVTGCPSLKSLFSPRILGSLTKLQWLTIKDCSMLEEVIAKKEENVHIGEGQETKVVWKLPNLEDFVLFGLPRIHRFSDIHTDLELPLLAKITIRECPEVKNSLSLGLRCLPKMVKICGITDLKDASRFFFNKELTEDEDCLNYGYFKSDLSFNPSQCGLCLVQGLSNEFFFDGWRNAHGEIEIEKLSFGITYEVIFVIMLVKERYLAQYRGLELIINVASDMREEDMTDKLTEEWIEILGGEFTPTSGQYGQLRFSIAKNNDYQDGILLKGVYIRPKEIAG